MKNGESAIRRTFCILILAAAPACGAHSPRYSATELPQRESWHALNMEATAIMGELKYQHGDLSGARETFRSSLNSSTKLMDPQGQVMGLDLYRSAELAARRGDFAAARKHLEILLSRYPGSDWARKGQDLLDLLARPKAQQEDDEPLAQVINGDDPELSLARIQSALKEDRAEEALASCREFAERHPEHPSADEVRLTAAALYLRLGSAGRAARILKPLAGKASDAGIRSKAAYLLGAAYFMMGDHVGIQEAIPDMIAGKDRWRQLSQIWRAASDDKLGRREAAIRRYRELAESGMESPVRAYALAAMGRNLDLQGRPREAASALKRAAAEARRWRLEDLESASTLSEAHLLFKRRRLPEAAAAYADFALRRPGHPQRSLALYQEGLALRRLGRKKAAIAAFSELIDKNPDPVHAPDAHLQMGQLYAELGSTDAAIAHYRRIGEIENGNGRKESILLVAQVHYNQKRFKEAIPLYWRFLEENPGDPRSHEVEELLLTSYWMGDRGDPGLLKAAALYPDHAIVSHIRWELGAKAYQEGYYERAVQLFARYSAEFPKAPHAAESLFYQGESLMRLGDAQGAARAYRAFIAKFPGDGRARQARLRLGTALHEAGEYEASAQAYAQVGGNDASAADALYNRGVSLGRAGRREGALSAYEQLLARFPRHPKASWAWFQAGTIRESLGRLAPAALAYAHVASRDPNRIQALYNLGRLRERLKQTSLALAAYEGLRPERPARHPARLKGLLRLALLYELKSQPRKARPLYSQILSLSPDGNPDSEAARKRLDALTPAKGR